MTPLLDRLRSQEPDRALITEAIIEITRLNAEIERWRDSNIRLRDEVECQAARANKGEWAAAEIRERQKAQRPA